MHKNKKETLLCDHVLYQPPWKWHWLGLLCTGARVMLIERNSCTQSTWPPFNAQQRWPGHTQMSHPTKLPAQLLSVHPVLPNFSRPVFLGNDSKTHMSAEQRSQIWRWVTRSQWQGSGKGFKVHFFFKINKPHMHKAVCWRPGPMSCSSLLITLVGHMPTLQAGEPADSILSEILGQIKDGSQSRIENCISTYNVVSHHQPDNLLSPSTLSIIYSPHPAIHRPSINPFPPSSSFIHLSIFFSFGQGLTM